MRTVIELGHSLGKKIVAEGVESEAILQALSKLGCDIAQGYHISRPMSFEALTDWLSVRNSQTPAPAFGSNECLSPDAH